MKPLAGTQGTSWERHRVEGGETLPWCDCLALPGRSELWDGTGTSDGPSPCVAGVMLTRPCPGKHARSFPYLGGPLRALSILPAPRAQRTCQPRLLCNQLQGMRRVSLFLGPLAQGLVGALLPPPRAGPAAFTTRPRGAATRCCTSPVGLMNTSVGEARAIPH